MSDPAVLQARKKLIVALDVSTEASALEMAERLEGRVGIFKIGLELFAACGPEIVRRVSASGHSVFLDLKLHDIPNTVAGASRVCASLGVRMLTLHTQGGRSMLEAARRAVDEEGADLRLLGVTVLTSLDEPGLAEVGVEGGIGDQVGRLAQLATAVGLDGIVSSGHELERIRNQTSGLFFVTPGIRPSGADDHDQSRVLTPGRAIQLGADYLVVGRPITRAADPGSAADAVVAEIAAKLSR